MQSNPNIAFCLLFYSLYNQYLIFTRKNTELVLFQLPLPTVTLVCTIGLLASEAYCFIPCSLYNGQLKFKGRYNELVLSH